jgi:hypothetical protein
MKGSLAKRKPIPRCRMGQKFEFLRALVARHQPFDADHAGCHEKASEDDPQHGDRFFMAYCLNL